MARKTKRTIRKLPGPVSRDLARLLNDVASINRRMVALVDKVGRLERMAEVTEHAVVEVERLKAERKPDGGRADAEANT